MASQQHSVPESNLAEPTAEGSEGYFSQEELEGLEYWRAIVAEMPPMTQEEIERVAALFNRMDARRNAKNA